MKSRRGRGKKERHKKRKRAVIMGWSVLLALVSLGVLVGVGVLYFGNQTKKRDPSKQAAHPAIDLEKAFASEDESELPSLGEKKSLKIVSAALANRDPLMFDDYFIAPEVGTTQEAIADLARLVSTEGEIHRMQWTGPRLTNGRVKEEVVVFTQKDGKERNRLAQLVPGPGDRWLIDFDSYLRAASAGWEYILRGEAPVAKVRVFIAKETYYSGIFSDDEAWQAYAIVSPDTNDILYGYCKKESPQNKALARIVSTDAKVHRATLEISKLPKAGDRQFEISRIFAEDWVVSQDDFDESF